MDLATEILRSMALLITLSTSSMDIAAEKYADSPLFCLAQNIYFEARNQDFTGKVAIGYVTTTRVDDPGYPNSICKVVYQGPTYVNWLGNEWPRKNQCQFSWNCDGKPDTIKLVNSDGEIIVPNRDAWRESVFAAIGVIMKAIDDPTNGATHYYNPKKAKPTWRFTYKEVALIGDHSFRAKTGIYE